MNKKKDLFEIYLDLSAKNVLVAGDDPTAISCLRRLSACTDNLFCLSSSPALPEDLSRLSESGKVTLLRKEYQREDLFKMDYVICCVEDPAAAHDIYISCRTLGIRVCTPSDPARSDFYLSPETYPAGNTAAAPQGCKNSGNAYSSASAQNTERPAAALSGSSHTSSTDLPREAGLPSVTIYTDGAARGNPNGPGGYGTILEFCDSSGKLHQREYSQGYIRTTNNRMELMAAIVALEKLGKPCRVELWSDSQYLINAFNQHWIDGWIKKNWMRSKNEPVKNTDLWKRLLQAARPHEISWKWVRGHNGHPQNERCDQLATSAADSGNLIEDTGLSS